MRKKQDHRTSRYAAVLDAAALSGDGPVFGQLYRAQGTKSAREWLENALDAVGHHDFPLAHLRHTFASCLVMKGVDIRTVRELSGHKDIQVTLRYAHLAPQHQLEAVRRLCDTEAAQNGATETGTSTSDLEEAQPITAS